MATVLVIDDEQSIRRTLRIAFDAGSTHDVHLAATAGEGLELWRKVKPDVVLLDLMLPDRNGMDILEAAKSADWGGAVIIITGHQDLSKAITAMRAGAFDYIHKPLSLDELELTVERALQDRGQTRKMAMIADFAAGHSGSEIVGQSEGIIKIHKMIGMVSRGTANVLISGESGTGKELVARAIHRNTSPDQPFIPINCSAFVPTLLESELFGHEKGAFTGAFSSRPGRFELAAKGTLFLDEIGDMNIALQTKLLRVLQERKYERVGGNNSLPFTGRVVAATHRDLADLMKEGSFREDLYYRLNVVEIHVPPLRERIEDIPLLIESLLIRINHELRRHVNRVPNDLIKKMQEYTWPGNVRELENRLMSGVMLSSGDTLNVVLPSDTVSKPGDVKPVKGEREWRIPLSEWERAHICRVLKKVGCHFGEACEILQISRPTLRRKIETYHIDIDKSRLSGLNKSG